MAKAIKNALILLVNSENNEISSAKYPPKLPVIKRIIMGTDPKINE